MAPDGENFPPILEQSAEHIRSEEGAGRAQDSRRALRIQPGLPMVWIRMVRVMPLMKLRFGGLQFSRGAADLCWREH